jgi:hypothetical protein
MLNHPQPGRGVVMGAIDAHAVHALQDQVVNKEVIISSLTRHCDHDPDAPSRGPGSQQGFGVFGQQPLTSWEIENSSLLRRRPPGAIDEKVQNSQNRIDRGQDMRLGPPEGGKSHRCKPELKRAEVAAAEGKIMEEVPGTVSLVRVNLIETWRRHRLPGDHIRPDGRQLSEDALHIRASRIRALGDVFRCHSHSL